MLTETLKQSEYNFDINRGSEVHIIPSKYLDTN